MAPFGDRIRELREEKGWSQDKLAKSIGAVAHQISRYEHGHMSPSAETLVKIAETFDVSLDYLLVEDSPRRPLRVIDNGLIGRLAEVQGLSDQDRESLFAVIDAFRAKSKLRALAADVG
jgi:transcriptional regulator with XRE-family HTH domain